MASRFTSVAAALTLALVLAACGQQSQNRTPEGSSPGIVEDAAPPAPPTPGNGYLKIRKVYDYVGDRAGTPWAPFELNGDYNYPEAIFGGWPMRVTPVDLAGNATGPTQEISTLQELSPTDGRYVELAAGRYRVEERLPVSTSGGGVWSVTGANSSVGSATTAAGATTSQFVTVTAGETTVARFFNVCRVNNQVQTFPEGAREDINTFGWACRPGFGAAGTWTGVKQFGTTNDDDGFAVAVDSSANVYVAGTTYGDLDGNANAGGADVFLVKYDSSGTRLWTRQLGSANTEFGLDVAVDSGENAYITGGTGGSLDGNTNAGDQDAFLVKYDLNGTKQWTRQLGSATTDAGNSVAADSSGNTYVAGSTGGSLDGNTSAGDADAFVVKYDPSGTKQ